MDPTYKSETCPVCGEGVWRPMRDGVHRFRFGRKEHAVEGMHYAICDKCESRGFLPDQQSANRSAIAKYQQSLPGYIAPSDVLAVREKYGLTQEQAAKVFGGGILAFSKWETGKVTPSEPTAKLIRLALRDERAMAQLAEMSGVVLDGAHPNDAPSVRVFHVENISYAEHGGSANFRFRGARVFVGRSKHVYSKDLEDIQILKGAEFEEVPQLETLVWHGSREKHRKKADLKLTRFYLASLRLKNGLLGRGRTKRLRSTSPKERKSQRLIRLLMEIRAARSLRSPYA